MAGAGVETTSAGAIDVNNRRLVHLAHQTVNLDYQGGTNPIYIGRAEPGAAPTDPVWAIQRLTYDGNGNPTNVQWASGSIAYAFVWNDRTTLSYS